MPARRSADRHIRISDYLPPRLLTRPDEWKRLRLLLTNTEGGIILFGLYRSVAGRELVVESLRKEGPLPVLEITLTPERPSLFRQLEELDERPRSLVNVYGLEEVPEALRILNLARERFHYFSHVFLFWVTPGGLKRIASEAPDFWDWRTAVLDFTTPPEGIPIQAVQAVLSEPLEHDTAEELRRRLEVYESLLKDLRPSAAAKGPTAEQAKIDLLLRLGIGAYQLGDYSKARRAWEEALSLAEKIGSPAAKAALLHNLGTLHQSRGDYAEAERLYRESLEIEKQLGNKAGVAATLHQLGMLAQARGDYGEAERLYRESLEIKRQLGDKAGVAQTLHQLGTLAQDRGDYGEAERLYRESLEIEKQLGDKAGVAATLHQLGMLAQARGDYGEAERLYRESLEIAEQLGDKAVVATTLAQLAVLEEAKGNIDRALELTGQAEKIFKEIGAYHLVEKARRQMERLKERKS